MTIFRNSQGKYFQSGIGGTYPVNDDDPQNNVEDFDQDKADAQYEDEMDAKEENRREQREY